MKRLLSILPLLLLLLPPTELAAKAVPPTSRQLAQSVAPIDDSQGHQFCTAWSVNRVRGLWVTAAHCLGNEGRIQGVVITPVMVDLMLDIAVVTGPHVQALVLAARAPQVNAPVLMIGYPFGFEQVVSNGKVKLLCQVIEGEGFKTLFAGLAVGPGNSGGPILVGGRVVSVLQLGWTYGGFFAGSCWLDMVRALQPFAE